MLVPDVFHLQGAHFILVSLQKSVSRKASSSFMCSHLLRIRPAKPCLVSMAQHGCPVSAGAEVLRFHRRSFQQQCITCMAAGVLNLGDW